MTAVMMLIVGVVLGALAYKAVGLIREFVFTAAARVWKTASVSAAALTQTVASVGAMGVGRSVHIKRAFASVNRSAHGAVNAIRRARVMRGACYCQTLKSECSPVCVYTPSILWFCVCKRGLTLWLNLGFWVVNLDWIDIRRPVRPIARAADGYMRRWASLRGRIWTRLHSRVVRIDANALMRRALFWAVGVALTTSALFGVDLVYPDTGIQHAVTMVGYVGIAVMAAMCAVVITAALVVVAVAPVSFWRGARRQIASDVNGQVKRIRGLVSDMATAFVSQHPEDVHVISVSLRPILLMFQYGWLKPKILCEEAKLSRIADMGETLKRAYGVLKEMSVSSSDLATRRELRNGAEVCLWRGLQLIRIARGNERLSDMRRRVDDILMELMALERELIMSDILRVENDALYDDNKRLTAENERLTVHNERMRFAISNALRGANQVKPLKGSESREEKIPEGYGGRYGACKGEKAS